VGKAFSGIAEARLSRNCAGGAKTRADDEIGCRVLDSIFGFRSGDNVRRQRSRVCHSLCT